MRTVHNVVGYWKVRLTEGIMACRGESRYLGVPLAFALAAGLGLLAVKSYGQPAPTSQLMQNSVPPVAPAAGPTGSPQQIGGTTSMPGAATLPIREVKEAKVTKETKEIKDRPSTVVGLADALGWPVGVFLIVVVIVFSAAGRRILGLFPKVVKTVSVGGVTMEISQEAADEVRKYLGESFDELVKRADIEYRHLAAALEVYRHLATVIIKALPRVLTTNDIRNVPPNVRSTIYVPDIVFQRCLYQLVKYYPHNRAYGSQGRRFSERFGIIGRSWRLGESTGRGNALGDATDVERELIEHWGMTREEAGGLTRSHPADLCVVLKNPEEGNIAVGLVFIDSTEIDGFGADAKAKNIALALEKESETVELSRAVGRVMGPLRLAGPKLEITSSS